MCLLSPLFDLLSRQRHRSSHAQIRTHASLFLLDLNLIQIPDSRFARWNLESGNIILTDTFIV
jgi:hypothetical protein